MSREAFEAARAGGVIDTATGIPKSREEMHKFYEFIRNQTRDAESKAGEGSLEFPAGYMFKDPVHIEADELGDPVDFLLSEMEVKHLRDLARVVNGQHGKAAATLGPALKPLAAPFTLQKLLATVPAGAEPPDELVELLDQLAAYGADLLDPLLDRIESAEKPDPALVRLAMRAAKGKKARLLERLQRAATPVAVETLLKMVASIDPAGAADAGKAAFAALLEQVLSRDTAGTLSESDADAMGASMAALAPAQARQEFAQWVHPPQAGGLLGKLKARKPRRMLAWTAAAGLQGIAGEESSKLLRELADQAQGSDEDLRKRCLKALTLWRRIGAPKNG